VTALSVQDPFVLDHNTASNVSERLRCDIVREFQRASDHCRNLIGCSDSVDAEHAGIVELLSDSTSSVSSPAARLQLALSPQLTADVAVAGTAVPEEFTRVQLFVLRCQDSDKPATAAATVPGHGVDELEHGVAETKHRVSDDVVTASWCCDVVGMLKLMLADIFDMDCVSRDLPSDQFDFQLSQLLMAKADLDGRSSVQNQQCNLTVDSLPPSARSCVADNSELPSDRKHTLPEDSAADDDDDSDIGNDNDSGQRHSAKRHKTSDSTSDGIVSSSSSKQLNVTNNRLHVLLSADCSARSRLWVGRKKVRRRLLHFSDELKIQLEVSSALRKEITKSDDAILDFELAIIRPLYQSNNKLLVAVLPSRKTSKEFGCFVTFFISLVQKLVNNITVEGPVTL